MSLRKSAERHATPRSLRVMLALKKDRPATTVYAIVTHPFSEVQDDGAIQPCLLAVLQHV
jgi:hypothetical protein